MAPITEREGGSPAKKNMNIFFIFLEIPDFSLLKISRLFNFSFKIPWLFQVFSSLLKFSDFSRFSSWVDTLNDNCSTPHEFLDTFFSAFSYARTW